MLLNLVEQRFVADVQTCSGKLSIPVRVLERLLNFLALRIVFEIANQGFEIATRTIGLTAILEISPIAAAALHLKLFNGDGLILKNKEALHEVA